jgi:type I restriction enzyme, R subunit
MALNEADTCRIHVTPKLQASGWDATPHSIHEQAVFTNGRVFATGGQVRRGPKKRADYILRYARNFMMGVVEAKPEDVPAGSGLQQAKDYAETLGIKFAYATNGHEIIEFDYLTGIERQVDSYPSPKELWTRLQTGVGLSGAQAESLLSDASAPNSAPPRYYQEVAINRSIAEILSGNRRVLLTMATGTGKTVVAFQICWKLWNGRWNRTGEYRRPRILYLADRNILIDDPKDKTFAPFGDARFKIEGGKISKSREMYFAIYQAIAQDENRPGLYKSFTPDFFDLIIVDECHRGSARDQSNWREILEYFEPAFQLGMTATPMREDNRDTYRYFGNPIYTYSLKQGIEDGYLAPYRVHRVVSEVDAAGWRPSVGELDRYGREIPDEEYSTKDFERVVALRARTEAIAKNLTEFMRRTDRFAKTIVFCVDQEHADEMRRALSNLNQDLVRQFPDYVARVTADEGGVGRGHLSRFQELETTTPVILTTSQLLTTGVDAPTCKNVVLARVVNSMTEFKQIIGRGTRMREDYGKLYFNIVDYTGSATQKFADATFDGFPEIEHEIKVDAEGNVVEETFTEPPENEKEQASMEEVSVDGTQSSGDGVGERLRKFYVDGGQVKIAAHLVYELDGEGRQLRVVQYSDYTASKVRTLFTSPDDLRNRWIDPLKREDVLLALADRGIDPRLLADATGQPDADPFDLLCHVAFNAPLRTRRERAETVRKRRPEFFAQYGPEARDILDALLKKYSEFGPQQLVIPDALQVAPVSSYGNILEIANLFGGAPRLRKAVDELQNLIYSS